MSLKLKAALRWHVVAQSRLAGLVGISDSAMGRIVNHNQWPASVNKQQLKTRILQVLQLNDMTLFEVEEQQRQEGEKSGALLEQDTVLTDDTDEINQQEIDMLLKKHALTPEAKRVFGIFRDPFAEVQSAEQVYLTPDARYVRESLRSIARHGGFAAVIGESGAGKSTLRRDLVQWTQDVAPEVVVIEPYVLGMEDNDKRGKTLKAAHIAEAIMATIARGQPLRRSPEARFRQVHEALRESHRAGMRHVLVIEEAHCLPIPTLKHLKRFIELEDGFAKLLSVVLIGQPELGERLDERNPRLREVVQRCEVVTLRPLDMELEAYLRQRFDNAGLDMNKLLPTDAIEALRTKLTGRNRNYSLLYPLAVHNVLTAAFNEAARLGIPQLSADLIKGV